MSATRTTTTTTRAAARKATQLATIAPKKAEPEFPDIQTIRNAIPAHCFEPSTIRSLGYVLRDFTLAGALFWAALTYIPSISNTPLRIACWVLYTYVQGLVGVGIWILAHEAGHGAFSKHKSLNDFVGWVLHSVLLVPYFSWKYSHHRHHRFTGNFDKDMAFVPKMKEDTFINILGMKIDIHDYEDLPIVQLARLVTHQLAGWQLYLLFNITAGADSAQRKASWWRLSHFDPTSGVFRGSEAAFVGLSTFGIGLMAAALCYAASNYVGWMNMCWLYLIPYVWVHHWLGEFNYIPFDEISFSN